MIRIVIPMLIMTRNAGTEEALKAPFVGPRARTHVRGYGYTLCCTRFCILLACDSWQGLQVRAHKRAESELKVLKLFYRHILEFVLLPSTAPLISPKVGVHDCDSECYTASYAYRPRTLFTSLTVDTSIFQRHKSALQ